MFQDLNPLDKSTAMLEILIMVAGAALLGFFIGWLFQKLQRDKAKADLRFTNDKLKTLQTKADSSIKEHSDLTRIVEDLRSRKDALFSELEAKKSEIKTLNEQLTESPEGSDEALALSNEKISRFETERDAMRLEIEELKTNAVNPEEMETLRSALNSMRDERDELNIRIHERSNDSSDAKEIERLNNALDLSREEQQRLQNQVETLSKNTAHIDEITNLQAKIATLESKKTAQATSLQASASNEELNDLKEEVKKLNSKYKDLEEEYEELEDKFGEKSLTPSDPKEIAELRLQVAALENEKATFQERIAKLEHLQPAKPETLSANPAQEADKASSLMSKSETALTYEDYQNRKQSLIDSVGKASEAQKDSFSKIVGIGPFIEAKLNSIGIYTYSQISKFKETDIDHVTRLIEFFPGRIERDGWVRQADKLIKKRLEENGDKK